MGMSLDEQRSAAHTVQHVDDLPGVVLVLRRIRADDRDVVVAECARGPDRSILRMHEVRAATRVRDFRGIDQGFQFAVLGIDHRDLVGLVRGGQEVPVRAVPAAVMQEASCGNRRYRQVFHVLVVDQQDLARFLDVHDELGMLMRGNDRCNAWFRVVFLSIYGHAACRHDLLRLKREAVHDHVLRRPVGSRNCVFVFKALVLRRLDRTRFQADLDRGDLVRLLHPQVYHVDLGVAANHVQVASR